MAEVEAELDLGRKQPELMARIVRSPLAKRDILEILQFTNDGGESTRPASTAR
jgi:hypothetical protein